MTTADYGLLDILIISKGYAIPNQTDGRKVVKDGLNFSSETKTLTDWVIAN